MLVLAIAVLTLVRELRWSGDGVEARLAAMDHARARMHVTVQLSTWNAWSPPAWLAWAAPGLFWALVTTDPAASVVYGVAVLLLASSIPMGRRRRARVAEAAVALGLSAMTAVRRGPTRSRRTRRWGSVALVAGLAAGLGVRQPDRLEGTPYFAPLVAVTGVGMLVLAVAAVVLGFTVTGRFDDDREVLA